MPLLERIVKAIVPGYFVSGPARTFSGKTAEQLNHEAAAFQGRGVAPPISPLPLVGQHQRTALLHVQLANEIGWRGPQAMRGAR